MASLDPLARREFLQSLMGSVAEAGTTVLLSSHILAASSASRSTPTTGSSTSPPTGSGLFQGIETGSFVALAVLLLCLALRRIA